MEANSLHNTLDAQEWARAFMGIVVAGNVPIEEDLMIGWFANAIMTGWDLRARQDTREREAKGA